MQKICTKCKEEKATDDFFVRDVQTGRLHAQCKTCYSLHRKNYQASHYQKYKTAYLFRAKLRRNRLKIEFRTKMLDYLKDKKCVICGETDIRVLELDHLDPAKNVFTISQAVKLGFDWKAVLAEMQKCQILCANCHKRRTAVQFGWYKA